MPLRKYTQFLVALLLGINLLSACNVSSSVSGTSSTAVPVTAQPTSIAVLLTVAAPTAQPQPVPTQAVPTAQPQPAPLVYYWPASVPQAMAVLPVESSASDTMFVINLEAPGTQWSATVTGGSTSRAAQLPTSGTQDVTVRGQPGVAFTTGAGYSLFWEEGGQQYAILSSLSLEDALALADGLHPLDQAQWMGSLQLVLDVMQ